MYQMWHEMFIEKIIIKIIWLDEKRQKDNINFNKLFFYLSVS